MAANFRALLEHLEKHGVRFVIIGGAAMVLQGASYTTEDLDVLYDRSRDNLERLAAALAEMGAKLRVEREPGGVVAPLDANALRMGMNFTLMTALGDFDIFGEVPGIGSYEAATTSLVDRVNITGSGSANVLSVDGLIAAKRAAGRPKDLAAIPELEAIAEMQRVLDGNS